MKSSITIYSWHLSSSYWKSTISSESMNRSLNSLSVQWKMIKFMFFVKCFFLCILGLRFSARYLYPKKYSRNWTLNPLQSPAYGTVWWWFFVCLAEMTKIILFCRRIVLINILLSFFQTILSSSFILLLILHKISSFSLNNIELCKNYSRKPCPTPGFCIPPLTCFEVLLWCTGILSDLYSRSVAVHKVGRVGLGGKTPSFILPILWEQHTSRLL